MIHAQITDNEYENVVKFCSSRLSESINKIPADEYPIRTKGLREWEYTDPSVWTSGFYPGCLWLSYKLLPDSNILKAAIKFTEGLTEQQYNKETHDIGFMILSSFGNGYKILNKPDYKEIILESAKSLSTRFNKKAGCIQSWNGEFQVIMDNMMNLELLFWAAKNGGGKNFYDIAVTHAYTTIKNHLRSDGSSFHVVVFDTSTGKVIEKRTHQGYSDSSSWARGQAWGIYGFTMCYRETYDTSFLNTAVKMAEYFINNLPEDYIPYWDLQLPADSEKKIKDASAAAIALSALLELRNYIDNKTKYDKTINNILHCLTSSYLSEGTNSDGMLLHCAYNVNSSNPFDWDASTVWGDYYFLESLLRYKENF
jgi:unsaturated chondroitin disaccharide hydrolase